MLKVVFLSIAVVLVAPAATLGETAPDVRVPALAEPPVGGADHEGDYLRLVHGRLHSGWVDGFIRISPYKQLGPSESDRQTEISLTIRWDGTVETAAVSKTSGVPDFDAAALNAIWFAAPFPPPVDVLADDGFAHLKWRFARNHRLCSGGEIVHVEFPLQIALPNLTQRGQFNEALRRMGEELDRVGWTGGDFLSPFARQWLARPNLSRELDTRAAAALALAGDRKQVRLLENALANPETAGLAATTLDRLGADVGSQLGKLLASDLTATTRPAVIAAVRAVPTALAACVACVAAVAAVTVDPRQPAAARIELIRIIASIESEVVSQAVAQAAKDANPAVRGAALLAQMPAGRGRVGVIRMAPMLHDPSPEIRAAAAAGVLKAGGDLGIEQLFLLGRERDPRPPIAAAAELGHMSSEASAQLLGKLLKRSDKSIRLAAIRALAGRRDAAAVALVEPILAAARANLAEDAGVRELSIAGATPSELLSLATDPRLAQVGYRALLRANLRQEAARWLIDHLAQMSQEDRITALGDWLAEPLKSPASASAQR